MIPAITRHPVGLGSDPEIFTFADKKLLPAFDFLPRKNEAEFRDIDAAYNVYKGVKTFWDGFQAEFEISRPQYCIVEMSHAIRGGLKLVLQQARQKSKGARLVLTNVVKLRTELQKETPDEFMAFGCMPSHNAYKTHGAQIPDPRDLPYRFSGGHLHAGVSERRFKLESQLAAKLQDRLLGIWAVGAAANIDHPIRRQYYGLAGEYRTPSSYKEMFAASMVNRFEYRTLSNFWLCHPAIFAATLDLFRQGIRMASDEAYLKLFDISDDQVIDIINKCDVKAARLYLKDNEKLFKEVLRYAGVTGHSLEVADHPLVIDAIFNIGMYGVEYLIKQPKNILKNWKLDVGAEKWGNLGDSPTDGIHNVALRRNKS